MSMSLDIKPEHHHSRLARSTCCQRPFRSRLGGRFGLTDGRGTSPLPSVLESFKHTAITERCQPELMNSSAESLRERSSTRVVCTLPGGAGRLLARRTPGRDSKISKDQVEVLRPFENLVPEWKPLERDRIEVATLQRLLTGSTDLMPGTRSGFTFLTTGVV